MPTPPLSRERVTRVVEQYIFARGAERSWSAAAAACGYVNGSSLRDCLERWATQYGLRVPPRRYESMTTAERQQVEIEIAAGQLQPAQAELYSEAPAVIAPLPDPELPVEELVEARKRQFAQRWQAEQARRLIPVQVRLTGPIGILHFGDPHVDDDGCNIAAIEAHSDLTRTTEGLFGANVGDTTNNWVGRLAKLYAHQSTTRDQAIMLAEWFVRRTCWLYMIGGNHDAWSGADDPLRWIARQSGALYQSSEVRLELQFPNSARVRVNARHDFAGSSQWNPAHGPMKALQLGVRDHIAVAGHKHESAYGLLKDADTGIALHAIKVASYKQLDRYAKDRGFRDSALGPACVTVIRPDLDPTHPDLVKVFWSPPEGADYLLFLRRRAAALSKLAARPTKPAAMTAKPKSRKASARI